MKIKAASAFFPPELDIWMKNLNSGIPVVKTQFILRQVTRIYFVSTSSFALFSFYKWI